MQARVRSLLDSRRLFAGILFLGIFTLAARNIIDPDFWWHLRTGQYVVETRSVPKVDPFSFTREGHPWIAHEWLSEALIYSVYRVSSWGGLIVGFAALTTATFFIVYLRCPGLPHVAGLIVLWGAFVCRPTWGVRPQTISFLFASLLLWILERRMGPRTVLWIVPLTLLWANLHAGYFLGIALLSLFLVGEALDGAFGFTQWSEVRSTAKWALLTLVLSLAVVVVNPNGWRVCSYPFATFRSAAMQKDIAEWLSPDFHRGDYLPLAAMLIAVVVLPSVSGRWMRPCTMLLICASAYAGLQSVRLIPVFVLIATPFLAEHAEAFLEGRSWSLTAGPPRALDSPRLALHGAMAAVLIVLACLEVRQVVLRQASAEAMNFPASAVSFLRDRRPPGRLFNDYNWGGYLIWKLYPAERVFIDGRADIYGDDFMNEYAGTYGVTGDWHGPLDRWGIAIVLVPLQSALANALQASGAWEVVFSDQQATILTRTGVRTQAKSVTKAGLFGAGMPFFGGPAPEPSILARKQPRKSLPGGHSRGMIAASALWWAVEDPLKSLICTEIRENIATPKGEVVSSSQSGREDHSVVCQNS